MNVGNKFQIRLKKEVKSILSQWIGHQRHIYNAKVTEDRYFRKFKKKSLNLVGEQVPVDQKYSHFIGPDTQFLKEVPSQILRNGAYKWMTAYQRFFKGVAKGRPTIQKRFGRQSVMITSELFTFYSIDKSTARIILGTKSSPIGEIEVNLHKEYEMVPNSICVSVHGGKWLVSFSYENEVVVPTEAELLVALQHLSEEQLLEVTAGFDRNVAIPVAASDGTAYDFTEEQKRSLEKVLKGKKKWQKRFARKKKGSANRRKATKRIALYDRKLADIRNDLAHKTSHAIANSDASLLVFENLPVQGMTASAKGTTEKPGKNVRQKAGLNRAILNSCWGRIKEYTKYKGLRKSKLTIFVPAAYSSQECSKCGHTHKDNRPSQALFICQACGFTCNADFNASMVVKKRGVRAVLDNKVCIKVPKKVAFTSRAGTVRTGAGQPAQSPAERVSVGPASKPVRRSRLKQETPTRTAITV